MKCMGCKMEAPVGHKGTYVCESCDNWAEKEVNYQCGYEVFK
jgi:hypothetical protein